MSLNPNPAVVVNRVDANTPGTPWLLPALQAATLPYVNATNTYSYSFANLAGSVTLNDYEAWADNSPNVILGANSTGTAAEPGRGGAGFAINYTAGVGDPTAAQLNSSGSTGGWIQVIDTNMPSARGVTYGANTGGGTTAYLDNSANAVTGVPVDPYYGHLSTFAFANSTGFLDETDFSLLTARGILWQAIAFPAKEADTTTAGVTNHAITIYSGVEWGFSVVPEPSTWVLFVLGMCALVIIGLRRRNATLSAVA